MPPGDDIHRYLAGVWRMMTGRPDGLGMLDLSVDGFWNSFSAIIIALPVMLASWVPAANEACGPDAAFALRLAYVGRLAAVDFATWVIPLAVFAVAARPAGLADRFIPYVVAANWGSALLVWLTLPVVVLGLFWPAGSGPADLVALLTVMATLVLSWRLTNVSLGRGPAVASGVFFGLFGVSLAVLLSLQALLGVSG